MSETALPLAATRGARASRAGLGIALCGALLVLAFLASLAVGPVTIAPGQVATILIDALAGKRASGGAALREAVIVLDIRLPRTLLGLLVGSGIATVGAMMQGIFRNPLADPALIGVSNGAALAAVIWIVLGAHLALLLPPVLADAGLPLMAFLGALLATLTLYAISTHQGRTSVPTMLFAGIAIGALAAAGTGVMIFMASDQQLRDFTFWSFGSLGGATWRKVLAALPFMAALAFAAARLGRPLDALALGEAEAFHVGVDVQRTKRLAVAGIAAGAGAAVAVAGVIGFVGLVVPHLIRLVMGPGHRTLLPAAALLGGALLLGADVIARTVASPAELPLGVVTAALGAPFFIGLLLKRRAALFG
ncbi:iron chelate uptake ABC transporter family permease subunit [Ancylobacter sp. MQZ15Z-1]|uniref:Iron chelate uptake ABC transporter family permease subunit n=1 Tax=Ancylobacter mangrovi TaxID=2972472 RepID=A0A9X2T7E7_9HYPH|nr:iron chelate uptake ABC transporter family permease subunit [Ancylobacter mangrovi]MCS0495968.1 iron chelate uptake ABC transporter family permease subunit [Ancylobacter mangrovi]